MFGKTVSDVVIEVLGDIGVTHIFGIPGDATNDVLDSLRRQDRIRFVQVRHEESGAFAAAAQAKLTGRLGVCLGTAGPGAVHLLNGLYDAKLDHAPVLAITGQVPTRYIGTQYHQEVDLYTLFKDVSAFNQVVMNPDQVPGLVVEACQAALADRGVSQLSLPMDIAGAEAGEDGRPPVYRGRSESVPCAGELDAAAALLNEHDRVAILAGIGALEARAELMETADLLAAPVIRTLRAKELVPDDSPFSVGGLGNLGGRPATEAIDGCDALLMVGTDFPYHDYYPDRAPAIQIDVEPTRLGRRHAIDIGLAGHARATLAALVGRLRRREDRGFLDDCRSRMEDWLRDAEALESSDNVPIRPERLARAVGDAAADDAVFVCDTGTVTAWAARHLRIREGQRFTLSSALASMAFAVPGAIGARLAFPDRQVIALAGDGGFSMLMGEFATAVKYALPITVVIFNNGKLGLIKLEQESKGLPEFATDLPEIDFAAVARACGGEGTRVTEPDRLDGALRAALDSGAPTVVDVAVDPEALIMPPKISAAQAFGFGMAKLKEWGGA